MTELGETPWVDRAFERYWDRIAAAAPDARWVPQREAREGRRKWRVVEHGCGHYGCVLPTNDEGLVVKLSSDPTEAVFVAAALSFGEQPDGLVRYHKVVGIPPDEMTHRDRPLFVIWREEAFDVGAITKGLEERFPGNPDRVRYERSAMEKLLGYLTSFKAMAAQAREQLRRSKTAESRFQLVEEAKDLQRWAWDIVAELDLDNPSNVPSIGRYKGAERLAVCFRYFSAVTEMMENEYGSSEVGGAFSFYFDRGILLADVHGGNVGRVPRVGFSPVITDPGHAVALEERWTKVRVPLLP